MSHPSKAMQGLAAQIKAKSPADQLRLAADLLDLKESKAFSIARSIVAGVDAEMTAVEIAARITSIAARSTT